VTACVHGLSRKQVKKLIDAGQVTLDGRRERKAATRLKPGASVEVRFRPSLIPPPELNVDRVLVERPEWLAIDKPSGLPTHRTEHGAIGVPERLGETLGVPSGGLKPVHRLDRETSGALLIARDDDAAAALSALFSTRAIDKRYRAVVSPAPGSGEGRLTGPDDMTLTWAVLRRSEDGSRAELSVAPEQGRTHQIRIQLAAAGTPIVGDLLHGSPLPGGAPRMGLHCERLTGPGVTVVCPPPTGWDDLLEPPPEAEVARPKNERRQRPTATSRRTLAVSRATARILRNGHPWVVKDADTGDLGTFRPGDLADLVDPRGDFVATAVIEPRASVCARVVSGRPGTPLDRDAWTRRAVRSLERRRDLLATGETDAVRLVYGEADGLPGLLVDLWGDVVVITRTSAATRPFIEPVLDALSSTLGDLPVYEREHLQDLRQTGAPRDAELPGRWLRGERSERRWWVHERNLRFQVEPIAGLSTGLYTDQRANRERLAALVEAADEPPTVANLFGHTGAFSVALAAAGAGSAITVDLAPRYLQTATANLVHNGLDPDRHPCVAADVRGWLARDEGPLDGAILDPPAFARGRSRGVDWSVRRDYGALVEATARRLRPGGWLLCCVNVGGLKRGWLKRQVEAGAAAAGRRVSRTAAAGPGADHPPLKGFPEGIAFRGLLAWIEC